jgi:hypothetical protein
MEHCKNNSYNFNYHELISIYKGNAIYILIHHIIPNSKYLL